MFNEVDNYVAWVKSIMIVQGQKRWFGVREN